MREIELSIYTTLMLPPTDQQQKPQSKRYAARNKTLVKSACQSDFVPLTIYRKHSALEDLEMEREGVEEVEAEVERRLLLLLDLDKR